MLKAWREWRSRGKLFGHVVSRGYNAHALCYEHLRHSAGPPEIAPYQGLAGFWDDYAAGNSADYVPYVKALARNHRLPLGAILDLACGTGMLTERLASLTTRVVGLDASVAMLSCARVRCAAVPAVALVAGDFRSFDLGERFAVVVCAGDSLNYVADVGELAAVFRRVAAHLPPGGLFLFDTSTENGMRGLNGLYFHPEASDRGFAIRYAYDETLRRAAAEVILRDGIEVHHRIPIDPADVRTAVRGTGLEVADHFFGSGLLDKRTPGPRCYFVLKRVGQGRTTNVTSRSTTL